MFTRSMLVIFTLLMMTSIAQAEHDTAIYMATASALENTQRNVRDKDGTTLTPDEQKGGTKDIKITTTIRKALVKDKSLSIDAQNAKIITSNRIVTLRGPVKMQMKA
jgi:hyperosmotically inducible periplasmic protein